MADEQGQELAAVVVVGASAGGIDALSELLGPIPAGFPAPIVVAQHTLSTRPSHLAEILAGRTRLSIVSVANKAQLDSGTVYLVPSGHHIMITDHVVEAKAAGSDRPAPSIDRLLTTAAEQFNERLIAVILSGMGSDGVLGAGEVKARGGTVVIQNPETAAQPAMPEAVPPTLVDFIADADRMGELLTELVTSPMAPGPQDDEGLLTQFLDRVRQQTGIDFSAYKRPTVQRRLQRRMVATKSPRLRDYVLYVQDHPDEYQRLSSAFLIKVTQFFRDEDLFEHLRKAVVPEIVEEARKRGGELRIWSAGTATGEEAYSLAILVADALGSELDSFNVRIFATDLDAEAITYARRGVYPLAVLGSVPKDLLDRWFFRDGDQYQIASEVRSLVVFGEHDLGQRAPFPRIDLILCRNVLIYFTPDLQRRALQLFAFSLREGGYLVLGKGESSTSYSDCFILDAPRLKIYRRAGDRVMIPPPRVRDRALTPPHVGREPSWATAQVSRPLPEATSPARERPDDLLLRLPIGVVVINSNYDISFLNAAARRLLGIHGPAVGHDFIHLAHQFPSDELRSAVAATMGGQTSVLTRQVTVESGDGGDSHIELTLQPFGQESGNGGRSVLITVLDVSETTRERASLELAVSRHRDDARSSAERIERLSLSNRELFRANEEMTNDNALLRGSNEELLVANEEVQAKTEEVETLNEELQATNEELETLNEELQATVEELNTTNDDLEARSAQLTEAAASLTEQRQHSEVERERLALILDGMSESVLVVDRQGRVLTANRAYEAAFGETGTIMPEDGAGLPLPEEDWPQARAARGEAFSMSFTQVDAATGERRWYEASGRGAEQAVGAVIVIRDITDRSLRHLQERFIDTASHELKTPIAAMHNYLQLVQRGAADSLDSATRGYLDRAIDQSRDLGELAARLFDMSLIRHGRLVVSHEPLDLRALLVDAIAGVRSASQDAAIDARLGRRRVMVNGDRLRLRQMLSNLLTNAVTHGASSSPALVTLEADDVHATIEISDRGPGIAGAVKTQLFTPFVATASGGVEGLGLGLFLARAIVGAHDGSLSAEGRRGGGTVVVVTLPVAKARTGRRDRSATAPAPTARTARRAQNVKRVQGPEA